MVECNHDEDGTVMTGNDAEANFQNRSIDFDEDGDDAGRIDNEGTKNDECWPPSSISESGFPCMDRNIYWLKNQRDKNV